MKLVSLISFGILFIVTSLMKPTTDAKNLYEFTLPAIDGTEINFDAFKGKKVLIVNVASRCGYTPQYAKLQELHEKHGDKVVLLGFPANNFGGQEPGSNGEIAEFCKKNYGVSFQMFEKVSVKGDDAHPLYQWLAEKGGKAPTWNFCKYLVDADGQTVTFFPSNADPMGKDMLEAIGK